MIVVQVGVQVFTIAIACHPLSSTFTSKWKRNSGIILSFSMNSQGIMENKTGIWYHYKISRLGFPNSYSWFRWWNQWKQANSGKSLDLRYPFINPYWFLLLGCPFFSSSFFFQNPFTNFLAILQARFTPFSQTAATIEPSLPDRELKSKDWNYINLLGLIYINVLED